MTKKEFKPKLSDSNAWTFKHWTTLEKEQNYSKDVENIKNPTYTE